MLDRGSVREAEAEFGIIRDHALHGDPVVLAEREAYWARSLFGIGHVAKPSKPPPGPRPSLRSTELGYRVSSPRWRGWRVTFFSDATKTPWFPPRTPMSVPSPPTSTFPW